MVPTIDPTRLPELLSKAFSIQTLEGDNGHHIRKITGWEYGFGGEDAHDNRCPVYVWLDTNHLLLFPTSGQGFETSQGYQRAVSLVPQAVVINLESQAAWLPPEYSATSPWICKDSLLFSPELGILITSRMENNIAVVTTYKYDGRKVADYRGGLESISPSRSKILIDRDTVVDLRTNSRIELMWPTIEGEEFHFYTDYYWSYPDETRIYRCCSYFADLSSGESFRFRITDDFKFADVQTVEDTSPYFDGIPYLNGVWVQDSTYFLIEWSWVDDGDVRYLPMFDPSEKIIFDLREKAGISWEWSCQQTRISPDKRYLWMTGWNDKEVGNYLVDLSTFEARYFPGKEYLNIDWSPNGKFAWIHATSPTGRMKEYSILSAADGEIRPLPVNPKQETDIWWHPSEDIVVYPGEDEQTLIFLDAVSMAYKELPFPLPENIDSSQFVWSSNGARFILTAEDGSLWQVDTSTLENLEQLTKPMPDVRDVFWSPDGNSISFVSGQDIYIVDAAK
jgi:WD40 repeat protein